MKLKTPEGEKEAQPLEFSLEEAERSVRVTCDDGTVLLCRPTIAAVFRYEGNDGNPQYFVNTSLSVVKAN